MKQITFPIYQTEGMEKFLSSVGLVVAEKTIDGLQQDANVHAFVAPRNDTISMEDAGQKYLLHGEYLMTIYGVYHNGKSGIQKLLKDIAISSDNKERQIGNISDLIA